MEDRLNMGLHEVAFLVIDGGHEGCNFNVSSGLECTAQRLMATTLPDHIAERILRDLRRNERVPEPTRQLIIRNHYIHHFQRYIALTFRKEGKTFGVVVDLERELVSSNENVNTNVHLYALLNRVRCGKPLEEEKLVYSFIDDEVYHTIETPTKAVLAAVNAGTVPAVAALLS